MGPGLVIDVAVIGAGLAGSATAWAATRRGLSVALFEQFELGHLRGSSHGSARIFRRAYPDELYVRMTGRAGELWRELELDTGERLRRVTGGLDHGALRDPQRIAGIFAEQGVAHELMPASEAAIRWPGMVFDGPVLSHPEAGTVDPARTIEVCVANAAERGALVHANSPVERIEMGEDHATVVSADRSLLARRVVVAAGAWVADLLGGLVPLPQLEVTQQQIFHFRRRDETIPWPIFVHKGELETYGLPGGRDGGPGDAQKVAGHLGGTITTAETRDGTIDPAARQSIVDYVTRWLPGLDPQPINEASCLYTSTPDEDFILDRIGPLVISSACSGHGAKFAPLVGEISTDLAEGRVQPDPRFTLGRRSLVTT